MATRDPLTTPMGICLGGSTCSIGIWQNGNVELIYNELGHAFTPCYVAYTDTEVLVGEDALIQQSLNPSNTIYDFKHLIGHSLQDNAVAQKMHQWPFKMMEGGIPKKLKVEVMHKGSKRQLLVDEVLSALFRKMQRLASDYLGCELTQTVVTVPAWFNDSQRQATKSAATLAGLNVMRIMNEPTATLLGCVPYYATGPMNYLICKWGGSALDLTALCIEDGIFEIIATNGLECGGALIDARLAERFAGELKKKIGTEILSAGAVFALRQACEAAKKLLTREEEATIEVELARGARIVIGEITRTEFEVMIQDFITMMFDRTNVVIRESRWKKEQLSGVIISGGTCAIPAVQRALAAHFTCPITSLVATAPALAPVRGVAFQGAIMSGWTGLKSTTALACTPLACTPLTIGIAVDSTADNGVAVMHPVISCNTYAPTRRTMRFTTTKNNQSTALVRLYEGECIRAADNRLIASVEVSDILPVPKGTPVIEVTVDLDADQLLCVTVCDVLRPWAAVQLVPSSGKRLSEHEIKEMVQQAKRDQGR